jgi:hypothetical protein
MKKYRHGDVLLKQIAKLPSNKKVVKDKVLAYGEVTGHTHRFTDPRMINRYEADGKFYLEVAEVATLIHEEHRPLIIEKGIYEQIAEREYDPFLESARTVLD